MILIVSHPGDEHATAVIDRLTELGHDHFLLDLSQFPMSLSLSINYGDSGHRQLTLRTEAGEQIDLERCRVAWWRRPQQFAIPAEMADAATRSFTYNEWHEAISGLWHAIDAYWVNPPGLDDAAAKKSYQLGVAAAVGLKIPDTLITNDVTRARDFAEKHGVDRTVYKSFSATEQAWRETRVLRHDELEMMDGVQLAPVIFQEYIPVDVDLRVTIIGEKIFPAAIHTRGQEYEADYRMELNRAEIEAGELPDDTAAALQQLMSRLGLVYGAIDLRRTPAGEHIFLEVNPAGQWLFMEQRTGQGITDACAQHLAAYDR